MFELNNERRGGTGFRNIISSTKKVINVEGGKEFKSVKKVLRKLNSFS